MRYADRMRQRKSYNAVAEEVAAEDPAVGDPSESLLEHRRQHAGNHGNGFFPTGQRHLVHIGFEVTDARIEVTAVAARANWRSNRGRQAWQRGAK